MSETGTPGPLKRFGLLRIGQATHVVAAGDRFFREALADVAVGDMLVIYPHDICPVDGVQEPQRERCSAHVTEVGFGRAYRVASWAARW